MEKGFKQVMKRFCFVLLFLACLLASCGSDSSSANSSTKSQPTATPSPTPTPAPKTANDVAQALKNAGMSIGDITVLTAETDQLLGRPGQYASKVNFKDTRIGQDKLTGMINKDVSPGGSIEVFVNADEMKARVALIKTLTQSFSIPEYDYQSGLVLLRVSGILTPEEAGEYDTKLKDILK